LDTTTMMQLGLCLTPWAVWANCSEHQPLLLLVFDYVSHWNWLLNLEKKIFFFNITISPSQMFEGLIVNLRALYVPQKIFAHHKPIVFHNVDHMESVTEQQQFFI
jgi:hypothetical protein